MLESGDCSKESEDLGAKRSDFVFIKLRRRCIERTRGDIFGNNRYVTLYVINLLYCCILQLKLREWFSNNCELCWTHRKSVERLVENLGSLSSRSVSVSSQLAARFMQKKLT
jgi:hypothetical protein